MHVFATDVEKVKGRVAIYNLVYKFASHYIFLLMDVLVEYLEWKQIKYIVFPIQSL